MCQFTAIFAILLHLFVYIMVYDLWAKSNWLFMLESVFQLSVAAYLFLMAYFTDLDTIAMMWSLRFIVYSVAALGCLPFIFISLFAFVAHQQADQIASYTVTSNMLQICGATLVSFIPLTLLTVLLADQRSYEINNKDISFKPDYHNHALLAKKSGITK